MPLTWEQSGQGPEACPIALQDAQQLCVEAGFTYRGADDGSLPLARRADLQGASTAWSAGGDACARAACQADGPPPPPSSLQPCLSTLG